MLEYIRRISIFDSGPPFDHSSFNPDGHYLYIASERETLEPAVIVSPFFDPADSVNCSARFFAHIHGPGVGNLTVYAE